MNYIPSKNGAVTAIRLFEDNNGSPMAELAFAYGGSEVVQWSNPENRKQYECGINSYTYVYDERLWKFSGFRDFVKDKSL